MRGKLLIVVLFVVAVAGVVWLAQRRGALSLSGTAGGTGPGAPSGDRVTVTFVYGTEKRDWVEAAAESFRARHRDVDLKLVGQGSLESAQAILEGKLQPTAWAPADSLVLSLLESDWRTKNGTALFGTGEDAPAPLVISPLVFVAWEDWPRCSPSSERPHHPEGAPPGAVRGPGVAGDRRQAGVGLREVRPH
jgi:hypothetical protein